MDYQYIIDQLPYSEPFLFVDEVLSVSEDNISGTYTFKKDLTFYEGHFKDNPVTPGVILTECMAQIGLVCFGIYLLKDETSSEKINLALSSTEIDFYCPVFPGEKVKVVSVKEYFRFNKLKCKVKMMNAKDEIIAKGTISGMIVNRYLK
ncbi:hydroxymyristoyl-ACP dehydratase [Aequorivita aquimaris]|uniref:Hydroxymyristoyl-ACP dehydratase n=1 Tax=Aequorivita aquimaris TaxID=1548749 RepID=A0A137RJD4_9FLAO|nr:3-hydroxyacyl-ACP dehydratase FabZ family protein [Aequorivita aquimaris]KXO00254.1 hydroxymyristoyl-ACP dehydratase [Aequorivita aquimaris]